MDDGLTEHSLTLSVDEDDLLALAVLVFRHGLLEHIYLIVQDISSIHAGSRLQHLVSMQVNHHGSVVLLLLLLALVGDDLLVLIHLLLQSLRVDDQRSCHLIILHDGKEQGRCLEEIILLEEMQLVEFHRIQAELHVGSRLEKERLILLVGHHLDGDMSHLIEHVTTELFDEELRVRLHLTTSLQCPGITLSHEIGVLDIIVAVVDEVSLETGIRDFLDIHRYEGEISAELVAAVTLTGWSLEGNLTVGSIILVHIHIHLHIMLVEDRFDASAVVLQFRVGTFLSSLLGIHLGRNHLTHGIVVLLHHYHVVDGSRNLEAILVHHHHDIFTLETGDLSASHFTQESYFITYFHLCFLFVWCKDTKDIVNGEKIYLFYHKSGGFITKNRSSSTKEPDRKTYYFD